MATPVIVTVDYKLPEEYIFADLRLAYTTSYDKDGAFDWETIDLINAQYGKHTVELSGEIIPPARTALH